MKDASKIPTLGPYAMALSNIIRFTAQFRKDLNPIDFAKCILYRGSGLTEADIQKYRQLAKNGHPNNAMSLFGYTSTSRNRSQAESFAFSNKDSGIKRVVFHIHWEDAQQHYFMNSGAFDHEEEILLADGTEFGVLSVRDEQYQLYELQNMEEYELPQFNGTKCVITNDEVNEDGDIRVHCLEGENANR